MARAAADPGSVRPAISRRDGRTVTSEKLRVTSGEQATQKDSDEWQKHGKGRRRRNGQGEILCQPQDDSAAGSAPHSRLHRLRRGWRTYDPTPRVTHFPVSVIDTVR